MRTLPPIHSHEDEELTEYELARLEAIKANTELLLSLGLDQAPATPSRPRKKARLEANSSPPPQDRQTRESSSQEEEEEVASQLLGRGVRPGRRRISREEPGWGVFAGVVIGGSDDDDAGEDSGLLFPASPPATSRGKSAGAARPIAASESPRPSSAHPSSSSGRKLRGRAESAPFILSRDQAQGQAQAEVAAPRRSARNEGRRTSPRTSISPAVTPQRAFIVPDSGRGISAAALVDSEGDFTFHTRVLPRLITQPAPSRSKRKRNGTYTGSSPSASASASASASTSAEPRHPLLQLGRTLPTRIHSPKRFGPIPGISPGTWYPTRMACSTSSLHAPTVAGISGDSSRGAYSLCLSGGYEDDLDEGSSVTFTGSGGRDLRGTPAKRKNLRTAPQSTHQSFENPLNAALKRSVETQRPVRVLRGFKGRKPYAPPEGYLYCGLYVVERCWVQRGQSGFDVCRFALRRLEGQGELPTFKSVEEEE